MAIKLYTGRPGAGKSYITVERVIIPALKAGRTVVTNIPLTDKAHALEGTIRYLKRGKTTMKDIADLLLTDEIDEQTGDYKINDEYAGAVFVIDELSMLFPAGIKQNQIDDKVKAFYSMHRHISGNGFATEVVVVTQDSSQINLYVKNLVDSSYRIEKTMVGKKPIVTFTIYSGCVGYRGAASKAIQLKKETITYKPETFAYYKSQTMGSGSNADETSVDDSTNLLKSPALKAMALIALLSPFLLYWAFTSFVGVFSPSSDDVAKLQPVPAPSPKVIYTKQVAPVPVSVPETVVTPESVGKKGWLAGIKLWLVASMEYEGHTEYLINLESPATTELSLVTSTALKEFDIRVYEAGGLTLVVIDGETSILHTYPAEKDQVKPFFTSG